MIFNAVLVHLNEGGRSEIIVFSPGGLGYNKEKSMVVTGGDLPTGTEM